MATVIDALVMTLGLDSKEFDKSSKKIDTDLTKVKRKSKKTADEMSAHNKRAAESYRRIKVELLGLLAALGAAAGVKGFLRDMVGGEATLGRLSRNLNVSARSLEAWGTVAAGVGEKASSAYAAMQALQVGLGEARVKGHSALTDTARQYGINLQGVTNPEQAMMRIAAKIRSLPHSEGMYVSGQLGMGSLYNLLDMPQEKLTRYLKFASSLSHITRGSARNAERLQMQWAMLGQRLRGVEERIFTGISPGLSRMMSLFSNWVDSVNWEKIGNEIADIGGQFLKWAKGFDWKSFWAEMKSGAHEVWQMLKELKPLMKFAMTLIPKPAKPGTMGPLDKFKASVKAYGPIGAFFGAGQAGKDLGQNGFWSLSDAQKKAAYKKWVEGGSSYQGKLRRSDISYASALEVYAAQHDPLGIRTNNPLDLKYAGQRGATKGPGDGSGGHFAQFQTMGAGLGAAARQLRLYAGRGNDTINGIVRRFTAGDSPKIVSAYIATVMKIMSKHYKGITANSHLPILKNPQMMAMLMRAMSTAEGTGGYITNAQIMSGAYAGLGPRAYRATHHNSAETHIGKVEVHTKSNDAYGIAKDIHEAVREASLVFPFDSGVN